MKSSVKRLDPESISKSYYRFDRYNSKQRMLTYWYQLSIINELSPQKIIEVGVGTGLVAAYLRYSGIEVATFDINSKLNPDYVGSILSLPDEACVKSFDMVLCSRVLHHLDFNDFEKAVYHLSLLTRRYCFISLPVNDFRVYLMSRITSRSFSTVSIPLPLIIKDLVLRSRGQCPRDGSGLWQINSCRKTSAENVVSCLSNYFRILNQFRIPEDQSHMVFVLEIIDG